MLTIQIVLFFLSSAYLIYEIINFYKARRAIEKKLKETNYRITFNSKGEPKSVLNLETYSVHFVENEDSLFQSMSPREIVKDFQTGKILHEFTTENENRHVYRIGLSIGLSQTNPWIIATIRKIEIADDATTYYVTTTVDEEIKAIYPNGYPNRLKTQSA